MVLPFIWFLLISVLIAGYALLDGFDLGVGMLYPFITKTKEQKAMLRNSIGPIWDGNEVWLLTAGGALFAAFPKVYATVISGFYLAMMLVLFSLIFRAVSLEYRVPGNKNTGWDWAFFLGSTVAALLFGVAFGNVIRGIPVDAHGEFAGNFFTLLNPFALLIGILGLCMMLVHGAAWIALRTQGALQKRAAAVLSIAHWVFVALAAVATIVAATAESGQARRVVGNPLGWIMIVVLVAGLVITRVFIARKRDGFAFIGSALGILGLVGIAAVGNYPNLVPALGNPERSLTVSNSASSHLTLLAMGIIALIGVPIVLAYTALVYSKFKGRMAAADQSSGY